MDTSLSDMRLDKVQLVSLFIEASLYGVEVLFFVVTIYLLYGMPRSRSWFSKLLFSMLMFSFNTAYLGTSLRRLLTAFVGTPSPIADSYFHDYSNVLYRLKTILVIIQIGILDILILYRCYLIWDGNRLAILAPAFSILCYIVTAFASCHLVAISSNSDASIERIWKWFTAALCVAFLIKLLFFAMILLGSFLPRAGSRWQVQYLRAKKLKYSKFKKISLIVAESGVLAGLAFVVLIPFHIQGRNGRTLMLDAMSPLTGISFLLIIMLSLLGLTPSTSPPSHKRKFRPVVPNNRPTLPHISTVVFEHGEAPDSDSIISPFEEKPTLHR